MSSTSVLMINAVLYTLTLIWFLIKYRVSAGVLIWGMYTVSAWASYFFIQQPLYASSAHVSEQTLLPCIYLYGVFVISIYPLMKLNKIREIKYNYKKMLRIIMIVCTIIQIAFVLVDLPVIAQVLSSPASQLASLRSTVYGDDTLTHITQNVWLNRLSLLFSGMRILASGLSIIMLVTYDEDRTLVKIFALSALLNNVRKIIVEIGRGEIVLIALLYICFLFLLRDKIDKKLKRMVIIIGALLILIGGIFFWAITVSRFGKNAGFYMFKYMGEPINNFNGILFKKIRGTTNGRAYFSLIYRYLFGETTALTANNKWDVIRTATGIRGDIFYTYVGGLIIEFGKVVPYFVALLLNRITARISSTKDFYGGDLVVLVFLINFFTRGLFLFPTQNFEGMFMMLYSVILYIMFRIRRNSKGSLIFVSPRIRHKRAIKRVKIRSRVGNNSKDN